MEINTDYYLLLCYVPNDACAELKAALFAAGAGQIGNYSDCCWQTQGSGQFRPLDGSNPHIGKHNKVEVVAETKLELLCPCADVDEVIKALHQNHPYETPAYILLPALNPGQN